METIKEIGTRRGNIADVIVWLRKILATKSIQGRESLTQAMYRLQEANMWLLLASQETDQYDDPLGVPGIPTFDAASSLAGAFLEESLRSGNKIGVYVQEVDEEFYNLGKHWRESGDS